MRSRAEGLWHWLAAAAAHKAPRFGPQRVWRRAPSESPRRQRSVGRPAVETAHGSVARELLLSRHPCGEQSSKSSC